MSQLRERWEGASLPGDYLLQRWLSGDEAAAFFEASAPDGRRVVAKLVPTSAGDVAAQLALWRRTRALHHPNLLQLLDCGRAELCGEVAVYAVFERADDTLASALAHAPLSETEAREVLDAVLPALGYLQVHGLALPTLDPEKVLGVGEAIVITTDDLREASPDTPYTAQLRAFWQQISPFTPARSADILTQTLGAHPDTGTPAVRAEIAPDADAPVRPATPAAVPPKRRPFPKWPLLAAGAFVLLILGLNRRPAPEIPSQPVPVPEAPAQPALAPVAETPAQSAPSPVAAPADPKPSPVANPPATPPSESAPAAIAMWRVIAYTYKAYDDAAMMVDQINQRHPDFQAAVFSTPEKKGYFLVSLGGRMSRGDAVRLQSRARAESLARGVYIKKFLD